MDTIGCLQCWRESASWRAPRQFGLCLGSCFKALAVPSCNRMRWSCIIIHGAEAHSATATYVRLHARTYYSHFITLRARSLTMDHSSLGPVEFRIRPLLLYSYEYFLTGTIAHQYAVICDTRTLHAARPFQLVCVCVCYQVLCKTICRSLGRLAG